MDENGGEGVLEIVSPGTNPGAGVTSVSREAMVYRLPSKHPDTALPVDEVHSWAQEEVPLRHNSLLKCLLGQETLNTYRDCTCHQHGMV